MAKKKKLNKKIVVIGLSLLTLMTIAAVVLGAMYMARRNPEQNLENARQALAEGDYKAAERYFGRAYAHGKTDAWKIERLFEMADLHLIHNDAHEANWAKALGCWNTVLNIDPKNIPARLNMMRYFYEMADSGQWGAWKNVHDNASELLKIHEEKGMDADAEILLAYGRAALGIAQRGGTAERGEYMTQAMDTLSILVERFPAEASYYSYLADAILLQGELNAQAGFINARDQAKETAREKLEMAVQNADDKAAALAARYSHEIQMAAATPESIEAIRAALEAHLKTVEPNARLLSVVSLAYEISGGASAEAELNRSIEAARQAALLAPEEFEYNYRLAMLLNRKGSAFKDAAAMEDAVTLAERMLTLPQTQSIPGPRQGRNLAQRNAVHVFLARHYLEKAFDNPGTSADWVAKAEPIVMQIAQYFGSSEHMVVQQWEGTLALAKGERDRGVRLLNRAYEQAKALDTADQPSTIDTYLCIVLARVAKEYNLSGLQREFLEKALSNRSRVLLDRPELLLDYADLTARFQAWERAMMYAQSYQQRYGATPRSQAILADAAAGLGNIDLLNELIASLPAGSPEQKSLRLRLVSVQLRQSQTQIAALEAEGKSPSEDITAALSDLRAQQVRLLAELIETAPEKIDVQTLRSACIVMLQNNQTDKAVALLDAYLAKRPETTSIRLLRLQAGEPTPLSIPVDRYTELQIAAAEAIPDVKDRALAVAGVYRARGELDKASETLQAAAGPAAQADAELVLEQFYIAIDRQDTPKAEELLQTIRARNLDETEGNLSAAQIEQLKKNYSLALRRVDEALVIKPFHSFAYYLRSRIYQEMQNVDAAVESSLRAIQMNPLNSLYSKNHASILFNRNNALGTRATLEQQNELIQAVTTAILLNPTDWQLQSVYAEIVSEQSPDRALAIRQQLLQSHPTPANAIMLGNMAVRLGKTERDAAKRTGLLELAQKAYTQAISIDPDNDDAKAAYAEFLRLTRQSEKAEELLRDDKHLLWRYYLQSAQYDEAEAILKTLYQQDPTDIHVLRGLILTAEGKGSRAAVKPYLDALSKVDREKEGELWVIQKYLDNAYYADAEAKLVSFKERHPDEKLVLLLEAWLKMTNGQLNDALTLANRYLESNADNPAGWRLRGRIHRLLNNPQRTIEDLQRSKTLSADPAVSIELAAVYSEMQQVDAAIGELVSGLQAAQPPIQMRTILESLYIKYNRLSDLERFYSQTMELFPNAPFWPLRAGQFYLSAKEPAKATPYLKKAWTLIRQHGGYDATTLNLYLEALLQTRQYDALFAAASEMIDSPLAPIAYAHMAQMQFLQGSPDKAEPLFHSALDKAGTTDVFQDLILSLMLKTVGPQTATRWIQNNPNQPAGLLLGYRLALQNEQFNRGADLLNRCLSLPGLPKADFNSLQLKKANLLVMAYAKTSDRDYLLRAIETFQLILKDTPDNPSILNNLAYMLAVNGEELETAVQYARRAHQSDPGNPTYLDTYAFTQYKNGLHEQSLQNLLRAVHLYDALREPIPWDVFNHLGLVHEAQGNAAMAIENYRKAIDIGVGITEKDRQQLQDRIAKLQQQAAALITQ